MSTYIQKGRGKHVIVINLVAPVCVFILPYYIYVYYIYKYVCVCMYVCPNI